MANDRWSYQVVELGNSFWGPPKPEQIQEKLNQMGQNGWELLSMIPGFKLTLVFKRPV